MTLTILFIICYLFMGSLVVFRVSKSGILTRRVKAHYPHLWVDVGGKQRLLILLVGWPYVMKAIKGDFQ